MNTATVHTSTSKSVAIHSVAAVVLTAGIFLADAFTPLSIAIAVLYGAVILMVSPVWSSRAVIGWTLLCMALTLIAYTIGHEFRSFGESLGRCMISLTAIAVIGFLVLRGQAANHALRQLNRTLEERVATRTKELEDTNKQLQQSQKLEAIGQLTGGIAHDFNNILQVIISNQQLAQMELDANHPVQQYLETAAFAAERGAKLSSQLLSFARRQPLQPKVTDLGRILRNMDDLLRRSLGEAVEIETVVSDSLWITSVDPHQLENAILNISINARDAMNGEGKLTLELGNTTLDNEYSSPEWRVPAGQYVMLAISDTGIGMSAETKVRAFEPFFTTKAEGKGTGLGLSMVFGFVKQSNGHIRVYSEVGHGTTIKIYLPRCEQPEEEVVDIPIPLVLGGSETILVVEDDMAVQSTVVNMLTHLGYRVLKANDGQSALNILQSGIPIDLLFTDVVMPGPVRSPDLAKQAKDLQPNIEVLFTSGYTRDAMVHGGRLNPSVQLISKPYRREDLARKIRHMLANAKPILIPETAVVKEGILNASTLSASTLSVAPLQILVVEDNPDMLKVLSKQISKLGHVPTSVSTAEKALNELKVEKFDVLLTDVTLPGMSGVELARKAVEIAPSMKLIISSGYGAFSFVELGLEAIYLPKPYNFEILRNVLTDISSNLLITSDASSEAALTASQRNYQS